MRIVSQSMQRDVDCCNVLVQRSVLKLFTVATAVGGLLVAHHCLATSAAKVRDA